MPEQLRIALLGPLLVAPAGQPLPTSAWRSRQERRLLGALLAARGTTLPTERLLAWLWPDAQPETAAITLRSAISSLRRILEPAAPARASSRYILTRDGGYAWNRAGGAWLDVEQFLALLHPTNDDAGRKTEDVGQRTEDGAGLNNASTQATIYRLSSTVPRLSSTVYRPPSLGDLQHAIALYRGDFLEDEPDAPWALAERTRLREHYLQALEALAEHQIGSGNYRAAIANAQRGIERDQLREPLYRVLMRAQALAGDTAGALQSYDHYRYLLDEALGAVPAAQTRELHMAILRGDVERVRGGEPKAQGDKETADRRQETDYRLSRVAGRGSPHPFTPSPLHPFTPSPLVGRHAELAALRGWVQAFAHGQGGTITIIGEAGIGKTRLAAETRRLALEQGALAISLRAAALEQALPFASLSEALRPLLRNAPAELLHELPTSALAQLTELLPLLRERLPHLPTLPPITPSERHNRQLDGLVDVALALAERQPLALFCDDAHWIDAATLTAIGRLARRAPRRALLIVLAYRPEELPDNPALHALLRALGREMLLHPCILGRLSSADVSELLATTAQLAPEAVASLAAALTARTGGNPLFMSVALQALLETHQSASLAELLNSANRGLQLPDLSSAPPIRDLLLARVARLPEAARDLLEQLAVIGRPVSLDLIEQLAGPDGLEQAQLLIERGFLIDHDDDRLGFGHELVRIIVVSTLASPRRRRLQRQAAEVVATLHPGLAG